jgi:hypothetical protein
MKRSKSSKKKRDTISEQDYTIGMASASTRPEDDSPGGSDVDESSEVMMGLSYAPAKLTKLARSRKRKPGD